MGRAGILIFNILLSIVLAALFALVLTRQSPALTGALVASGWAGLAVGAAVGIGAVAGPRPPLSPAGCLLAQLLIAATSALGAWIGSLFPSEVRAAGEVMTRALADRGVAIGSWTGAAVGTALNAVSVYRRRRREAPAR